MGESVVSQVLYMMLMQPVGNHSHKTSKTSVKNLLFCLLDSVSNKLNKLNNYLDEINVPSIKPTNTY